ALFGLIGAEANQIQNVAAEMDRVERLSPALEPTLDEWERRVEVTIREDRRLAETTREALVKARRGQGVFRSNVQGVERACRVTKVDRLEHLIASHVKPWRDSTNDERLDGENGLLLTPTIDHLFDKGFIGFEDKGNLIISPVADRPSLLQMGIDPEVKVQVGIFSAGQRKFLDYHRDNVLRMARRR
ncbi:MAG TPA: HNH endonuclease, partial [Vicinamibacterales bacterium]|nr:HNH endonuclease [Vicinamibacterales bacterium]